MKTPEQHVITNARTARLSLHRRRHRTRARGFTLLELMVVVVLISMLALIAAPSMARARNDRLAFDYARQASELFHEGRARAAGRGAAHLVVFTTDSGFNGPDGISRGAVLVFEGRSQPVDQVATPAAGPNPDPGCRAVDWDWVRNFVPGTPLPANAGGVVVDTLNIGGPTGSIQSSEDIRMKGYTVDSAGAKTLVGTIAMCIAPSGATYVGVSSTPDRGAAAAALRATPYAGTIEVDVTRNAGGSVVGLTRRIVVGHGAQPRIKSE